MSKGRWAGLIVVFLWFFVGGIAHFMFTETEMRIVPPYVPAPRLMVLVSGVFELLGALGLLLPATRRWAGLGLILLTLAVTPANVYMLQRAEDFQVPYGFLVARLPLQVCLLALIAWCTGWLGKPMGPPNGPPNGSPNGSPNGTPNGTPDGTPTTTPPRRD